MSNCYLCDMCSCKKCDATIDTCVCRCKGEIKKVVFMDDDERPLRDICDRYKSYSMEEIHKAFDKASAPRGTVEVFKDGGSCD